MNYIIVRNKSNRESDFSSESKLKSNRAIFSALKWQRSQIFSSNFHQISFKYFPNWATTSSSSLSSSLSWQWWWSSSPSHWILLSQVYISDCSGGEDEEGCPERAQVFIRSNICSPVIVIIFHYVLILLLLLLLLLKELQSLPDPPSWYDNHYLNYDNNYGLS